PVAPTIYAALRDDAARTLKAGDEMQRINLMDHPLVGNARRIWPIQAEFDVLVRIESLLRAINHEAIPVRVLRTQGGDELGAAPAHRLIRVCAHLDHRDFAEFARLQKLFRANRFLRAAP